MGEHDGYGDAIDYPARADRRRPPGPSADDVHRVLHVVALDRTGEVRVVGAVLEARGGDRSQLVTAEESGGIRVSGDRVAFADVALRSSVVAEMSPIERREIHRAFAEALTDPRHRADRAEHLAAAAVGPDGEASTALADLAQEASERGDPAHAGELFMRAGGLAPTAEERATHLYHAGDSYWNAGQYTAARAAFDAAYIGSTEPLLRADIAWQLGQLDMYQRGPRYARDLFVAAAEAVEVFDVDRSANLLVHAASTSMLSSDIAGALVLAHRGAEVAAGGNGTSELAASLMLAFLSFHHGDVDEFDSRFPALVGVAEELLSLDIPEVDLFIQLVGMVHVYTEQWDTGRVYLSTVAHRAGKRSRTATAALASATLAELCWRSGRWDEAWALATSDMVCEVTLTGARLWLLALTAHLDAGFGREDDCRRRAHASIAEAEPMGFGTATMWAHHALGFLELGLGRPVAAASHLDRVDAMATAYEIIEPSGLWWQADHVEALIRSGRQHEAARALARFEDGASRSDRAWAAATTPRCRALMADGIDEAEQWFETSLGHHDRLIAPFELARTLLCRAERRVATGSHLDPTADLVEAISIFDALGATSWSAQGSALRDTIATNGEPRTDELLSPAERRVAKAVVEGMTNRDVAAHLFISEKTVEFHLHNVYRKLGVHSRTQLARRLPPPTD